MADLGHQMTDEKLEQLERKVHKTYKEAYKEMQDKVDAYFDKLKDRDEEQKALLEAGKITEQQYQQWRLTQYARGERYRALRDEFARRMNEANKVAAAYINDQTPGIYSLNANYTAYTIEQSGASADFNLIQEQTVKRLIEEEPELFHRPAIDTPLDTVWNQRKLTDSLTAGILMGESTRQIADRFQKVTDMNRTSALRNARTAVTGAQNAGRQATYDKARAMGIEVDERWRSARDFRVRDSHRLMDGKPKDKDGYFHTPLGSIMRYPGDMQNGKAADVYNCRCTTSTRDALEAEPTMMRARDPVTGRNEVVQDMTYQEWYEWKLEQYGEDTIQLAELKIKHKNADQKQFENYRSVLGKNAPKTFEDFQNLKYNNSEKWEELKTVYRDVNWQLSAQKNGIVKGTAHKVPNEGKPNSVYDKYEGERLVQRRYYGKTGKPRLDIDYTDHHNPTKHPVVPHRHGWREIKNRVYWERSNVHDEPLTLADEIANRDTLEVKKGG